LVFSWGYFLPFGIAVLQHGLYLLFGGRSGFSFNQTWLLYLGFLIFGAILAVFRSMDYDFIVIKTKGD